MICKENKTAEQSKLNGSCKRLILGIFDWQWPDTKPVHLMTGGAHAQLYYTTWSRQVQMWYFLHMLTSYHTTCYTQIFNHETVNYV